MLFLFFIYATTAYADPTPQTKLTMDIERILSERMPSNLKKENAPEVLEEILLDVDGLRKPIFVGGKRPPVIPYKPDELRGCITKTRTRCTGTGKDKVCETESWEVCIGS